MGGKIEAGTGPAVAMRRPGFEALIALGGALISGCIAENSPWAEDGSNPSAPAPPASAGSVGFSPPVKLNGDGYGYEPSIDVGPDGTLYVTAHKSSLTNEGARFASWLWYSNDNGASWKDLPSPGQLHEKLYAFEGDVAVDAKGRLYFVDTYLLDNTISRWSPGPAWDYTRPFQGTAATDDRPFLAAHGDGIVYYVGNSDIAGQGTALPALNNLQDEPGSRSAIWLYVSEDGGLTWSSGHGFAGSGWCGLAPSQADDKSVFVGCARHAGGAVPGEGWGSTVYSSSDRGGSWVEFRLGDYEHGPTSIPSMAVDRAGNAYFAWGDGDPYGAGVATRLRLARSTPTGAFEVLDVTPLEGTIQRIWVAAGDPGTVALTFYATADAKPGPASEWFAYALVTNDATKASPDWTLGLVDPEPVVIDDVSPADFFQCVVGPDNVLHVAYQRTPELIEYPERAIKGYRNDLFYARQVAGPNLADAGSP